MENTPSTSQLDDPIIDHSARLELTNPLATGGVTVQTIETSGGATVAGDVNLGQGDLVGRDKNIGNIITGRDVIGSLLITGDHNQVFIGHYEHLQDAYINPESVFDRVNLEHFTGREWLLAEVDRFLLTHDRGYFILEADAGLGKTAFMAWLVKQRKYIHHFSELAPGQEGVGIALKNLAAQLTLAFSLRPEGILPGAATRPDYVYNLLRQAAHQRRQHEKIVLLVDALDEAGTPVNQNVLGLPTVLPEGVYVIVSQRPVAVALRVETASTPRYLLALAAADPKNQADMRRFLERVATWPGVVRALQENGYTTEQFTSTLLDKCRGVWIYLHYVVHEIERGERSPLSLAAFPNGMTQYYARYWQRWRHADETEWDDYYLPLLVTLAATQEALSCQQLLAWSGTKRTERALRRLLEERWRPFLAVDQSGPEHRYRFYHITLQEFFDGRVAQDTLSSAEIALVTELAEETRACHARLAERYLQAWGGWAAGLPGLQEAAKRDLDRQYGLRHLVAHLAAAGWVDDLHHLLRLEWVRADTIAFSTEEQTRVDQQQNKEQAEQVIAYRNAWYTVREAVGQTDGYLADVIRAWRLVEKRNFDESDIHGFKLNGGVEESWQNTGIGLQSRYALIVASLNSYAYNIRPGLLVELIKQKIWLPSQGLAYTRQAPNQQQRVETLIALVPFLPSNEQVAILQEALAMIHTLEDIYSQNHTLATLAPQFAKLGRNEQALLVARSIKDSFYRSGALADLAQFLSAEEQAAILHEALMVIHGIKESYYRAIALIDLAPYFSTEERGEILHEALSVAQCIEDRDRKGSALASLAPQLAKLGQPEHALLIAQHIEESYYRVIALTDLAPYFSPREAQKMLQEALSVAQRIEHHFYRESALANLAPQLAKLGQPEHALSVVRSIEDSDHRAEALAGLAFQLVESGQPAQALSVARSIEGSEHRAKALADLASHLSVLHLQEALSVAQIIEDREDQTFALANFAPQLAKLGQPEYALSVVRSIENSEYRAFALADLASYTFEKQEEVFAEALLMAQSIEDSYARESALCNIALRRVELRQSEQTLSIIQGIENPHHDFILVKIVSCLAESGETAQALSTALSISIDIYQVRALANLAPYLFADEQQKVLQKALSSARNIKNSFEHVDALVSLLPQLATEERAVILHEALTIARSMAGRYRVGALVSLLPQLATEEQAVIVHEALTIARSIEDDYDRTLALTNLLPQLAPKERAVTLREALTVACSIEDSVIRQNILGHLELRLIELSPEDLYAIWCKTLPILSSRIRSDLLMDLSAFVKLIAYLGGTSAIAESIQAIQDVGQWWP